ncbi:hypothetical protein EYF80_045528 [Liparis tanakae]|uniref:Uncharacterized protein n=1 Tax=Liparis tanakae TaxID=230148 RepID=A0A4Z2FU39_9TELE|nr:hypothetical protein EYF80_045528 [Liparis tanakae]
MVMPRESRGSFFRLTVFSWLENPPGGSFRNNEQTTKRQQAAAPRRQDEQHPGLLIRQREEGFHLRSQMQVERRLKYCGSGALRAALLCSRPLPPSSRASAGLITTKFTRTSLA